MLDDSASREMYKVTPRRDLVLALGGRCLWCGSRDGIQLDHILEQRLRPDLSADPENLQPLCRPCHAAKTAATSRAILSAARAHPDIDAIVERYVSEERERLMEVAAS
jgi:5-methylcytosine-specific restriction endonuclease McrA